MNMIYILYALSLILTMFPLGYILWTRQFQKYFVFFIVVLSFLVLNLFGTISSNITSRYSDVGFYLIYLITAICFSITFLVLQWYSRINSVAHIYERLKNSYVEHAGFNKKYIYAFSAVSVFGMLIFSLTVSPPFFLRPALFKEVPSLNQIKTDHQMWLHEKNKVLHFNAADSIPIDFLKGDFTHKKNAEYFLWTQFLLKTIENDASVIHSKSDVIKTTHISIHKSGFINSNFGAYYTFYTFVFGPNSTVIDVLDILNWSQNEYILSKTPIFSPREYLRISIKQPGFIDSGVGAYYKINNSLVGITNVSNIGTSLFDWDRNVGKSFSTLHRSIKPEVKPATKPALEMYILGAPTGHLINERIRMVASRPFHWFALVAFELPMFLLIFTTVNYQLSRNVGNLKSIKKWRFIFLMLLFFSSIASLWILSKQYILYLIASVFLISLIFKNKISFKNTLVFGIILVLFPLFLYLVYFKGIPPDFFGIIFATLYHRFFEVYPWATAIVYNTFPNKLSFLNGESVINLSMFHHHFVSLADMVYPKIYGAQHGSAPVPAIFESYANWGWRGIVGTLAIIMGTTIWVSLLSWSKNIWVFTLSCYLTIKLILFWQASLWFGTFEPTIIFFVFVMYASYLLFIAHIVFVSQGGVLNNTQTTQ